METVKNILENRTALMLFGAVVLLSSSAYLGVRLIPRHFNEAQIKKILYTAAFTSGVIGAIPIAIVLYFFLEDWISWGLDQQDPADPGCHQRFCLSRGDIFYWD